MPDVGAEPPERLREAWGWGVTRLSWPRIAVVGLGSYAVSFLVIWLLGTWGVAMFGEWGWLAVACVLCLAIGLGLGAVTSRWCRVSGSDR